MRRALVLLLLLLFVVAPAWAQTATPTLYTCDLPPPPTATPLPDYSATLISIDSSNLLAYWKLNDTSGTTATDYSGNARHGTYSGVTLNASTGPDGLPVPSFDGVNDYVNIYSVSLSGVFNGSEGTFHFWAKVNGSGVWTDGVLRRPLNIAIDGNNTISTRKDTASNSFTAIYTAGGTAKTRAATISQTTFFPVTLTWSHSANEAKLYINGSQVGATLTGLGTFAGTLGATTTTIGAGNTSGSNSWHGNLAHVAIWDVALSGSQITTLATIPTPATPTPAPDCIEVLSIDHFWTLEPLSSTGTPFLGQPVRFSYTMTAGQTAVAAMVGATLFSVWLIFLIWLSLRSRKKVNK